MIPRSFMYDHYSALWLCSQIAQLDCLVRAAVSSTLDTREEDLVHARRA